jgi:hypothetical protein
MDPIQSTESEDPPVETPAVEPEHPMKRLGEAIDRGCWPYRQYRKD